MLRGAWFLLAAGLFIEHLLCPRDHGLCVHHVTPYVPSPVIPGEGTGAQGDGVLGPRSAFKRPNGGGCRGHLLSKPCSHLLRRAASQGRGTSLCPGAVLPRSGPPEDLGKTPIPASPHRSESLDGAWESVCFTYSWRILIRSPALQGGMMDSTCES